MNDNAYKLPVSKSLVKNEYGLTERAHKFVIEYVYHSPGNASECARRAGYSEARARMAANELLNNKYVQAAIRREQEKLFAQDGPLAYQCMKDLMLNGSEKIRFKAAKDILDRGGWKAVQKIVVEHQHMTPEERQARIIELQKELSPQVIDITPEKDDATSPV